MVIWDRIPENLSEGMALCIGKFDGFHKGHRLLIEEATKTGYPVGVLTFIFHHAETIDSVEEKRRLAEKLGVDIYIEIEAGPSFFSLTPEAFIRQIVLDKLHARHVIVGEDFCFGRDRAGDVSTLAAYEQSCHYQLHAIRKLRDRDGEISSSRIREAILDGKMEDVARMLGRPYAMSGVVTDGNQIGRRMGVPTANLVPESGRVLPPKGVYAMWVTIDESSDRYKSIGNLGTKPTIGAGNPLGLEIHLLDYDGDLYGKQIRAEFGTFLRKEMRFEDVESLHRQIDEDIRRAEKWLR
ncbi:MAG: riboflavin biosynthesis protein RibF [Eubacterium sp.]|nr:riboflavin biosynthesis protein RibF [Eubacterium sp.]